MASPINRGFFTKDQKKQTTPQQAEDIYNSASDLYSFEAGESVSKPADNFDGFESASQQAPVRKKPTPASAVGNAVTRIRIMKPETYDDAKEIVTKIDEGYIVSMNLECVKSDDEIERIMIFLAGAVFALKAEIKMISDQVWLLFPKNHVQLSGDGVDSEAE